MSSTWRLWGLLLPAVCCSLLAARSVRGQEDDYGRWQKAEVITRPATRTRPRPVRISAPLLTMRWQFLVADEETAEQAVDPGSRSFADNELVRIAVQVNQTGYIYVINHTIKNDHSIEGPFLISRGQYRIQKDQERVLPLRCPSTNQRGGKCWWRIKSPPGREVITLIFSRDEIEPWKNLETHEREPAVDEALIYALTRESPQTRRKLWKGPPSQGLNGSQVNMVWNPDRGRNEVLVERIEFTHQ
ncbi:MAG TPA: DUF4384 domain-containing protein [Blastocatellia bacterium]|nr:DUF4384 domain-containing protein [Blastocatellia bacterium]